MDKVYLHSYCTLAASLATTPTEGLFWDRDPNLVRVFEADVTSGDFSMRFHVLHDLQYLILTQSPLYKRGWVLQESYLSPRTMHFSKFPAFECRRTFACEVYRTAGTELEATASPGLHHTTKTLSEAKALSYQTWFDIVYDYSRCSLTIATDKLIALCGVAKALAPGITNAYYAGIWQEWWLEGLLWMVDQWLSGYEMEPDRPSEYRGTFQ